MIQSDRVFYIAIADADIGSRSIHYDLLRSAYTVRLKTPTDRYLKLDALGLTLEQRISGAL